MPSLRLIAIDTNQLSGNIPSEIRKRVSLEQIAIDINQLSGNIRIEIGYLTNLTDLLLFNNTIVGSIPSSLSNTSLRAGPIPPEIGH